MSKHHDNAAKVTAKTNTPAVQPATPAAAIATPAGLSEKAAAWFARQPEDKKKEYIAKEYQPVHYVYMARDIVALKAMTPEQLDAPAKDGSTVLSIVVRKDYAPTVKFLLDARANPNTVRQEAKDGGRIEGITPLHDAVSQNNTPIAQLLLNAKANPNAVPTFRYISHKPGHEIVQPSENKRQTPLQIAAERSNIPMVVALLEAGAKGTIQPNALSKLLLASLVQQQQMEAQLNALQAKLEKMGIIEKTPAVASEPEAPAVAPSNNSPMPRALPRSNSIEDILAAGPRSRSASPETNAEGKRGREEVRDTDLDLLSRVVVKKEKEDNGHSK